MRLEELDLNESQMDFLKAHFWTLLGPDLEVMALLNRMDREIKYREKLTWEMKDLRDHIDKVSGLQIVRGRLNEDKEKEDFRREMEDLQDRIEKVNKAKNFTELFKHVR